MEYRQWVLSFGGPLAVRLGVGGEASRKSRSPPRAAEVAALEQAALEVARAGLGHVAPVQEDHGVRGDLVVFDEGGADRWRDRLATDLRTGAIILHLGDHHQALPVLSLHGKGDRAAAAQTRMAGDHDHLEFVGVEVAAAEDHQLLAAPAQVEFAVVQEAEVAGAQPRRAVVLEGEAGGEAGVVQAPVARRDAGAATSSTPTPGAAWGPTGSARCGWPLHRVTYGQ